MSSRFGRHWPRDREPEYILEKPADYLEYLSRLPLPALLDTARQMTSDTVGDSTAAAMGHMVSLLGPAYEYDDERIRQAYEEASGFDPDSSSSEPRDLPQPHLRDRTQAG